MTMFHLCQHAITQIQKAALSSATILAGGGFATLDAYKEEVGRLRGLKECEQILKHSYSTLSHDGIENLEGALAHGQLIDRTS